MVYSLIPNNNILFHLLVSLSLTIQNKKHLPEQWPSAPTPLATPSDLWSHCTIMKCSANPSPSYWTQPMS